MLLRYRSGFELLPSDLAIMGVGVLLLLLTMIFSF